MDFLSSLAGFALGILIAGAVAIVHFLRTLREHTGHYEKLDFSYRAKLQASDAVVSAMEKYNSELMKLADQHLHRRLDTIAEIGVVLRKGDAELKAHTDIVQLAGITGSLISPAFAKQLLSSLETIRINLFVGGLDAIKLKGESDTSETVNNTVTETQAPETVAADEEGHY